MKHGLTALLVCLLAASTSAVSSSAAQDEQGDPTEPRQAADGQAPSPEAPAVEGQGAQLPAGHPPVAEEDPAAGGGEGHAEQQLPPGHPPMEGGPPGVSTVLSPAEVASGQPSSAVPAGSIRVTVVDPEGRPVAGATVDVGVLAQGGDRDRQNAQTSASGVATFDGLATGSAQAYRVNVPYSGATYSSTPFQLPPDRGYDVRITRLPVTREDRFVFFHVFRVIVELRDDRLHVIQQVELTNAGRETYVFPAAGLRAALPEGALAFQTQRVMSDQRIEQVADEAAYTLRGSLPPGTVQLAWAYDVPVDDETVRIPVDLPMRFFGLQVFSEAPEGLAMAVRGMPNPQRIDNEGQPIWMTQVTRGPDDEAVEQITVTLSGIPGRGPLRWFAVVFAVIFVVGGIALRIARVDDAEAGARTRRRRREEIMAAVRELELDFENGEIGPEYRQSRRAELVRALAMLLHEEETAKEGASRAAAAKPPPRPVRAARRSAP